MSGMDYAAFLASKGLRFAGAGVEVPPEAIHPLLFDWQRDIVRWALRKGRACVFTGCGTGKGLMQVEAAKHLPGRVLIFAPLCVAEQTINEAKRLGVEVAPHGAGARIEIVNYEMLHRVKPEEWGGVVLDESSILKSIDGKIRSRLLEVFQATPYRLCFTATPAPNDPTEIGNHAHFIGVMTRAEMLASFFVNRGEGNRSWDLKGHAREAFYRWLASWACFLRSPSDLGYSDEGFVLPPLTIKGEIIPAEIASPGRLFPDKLHGVGDRARVRKATALLRVGRAAEIIKAARGQVIAWCGLNPEQDELAAALGDDCVSVTGSQTIEEMFSPPFAELYTYSASERDLGNARSVEEFLVHFGAFFAPALLRLMKPGRLVACHCQQLALQKAKHGVIGMRDFRGDLIRCFEQAGFIYHGEVTINKNPQSQAIRTRTKGLGFQQLEKDASWMRPAFADYIILMRTPGDNAVPVVPDCTREEWIDWAQPYWYGVGDGKTLQKAEAREEADEKHIAALQLGTIERCVRLWSNRGEVVFSPFAGIGSEGDAAIRAGRQFFGIELKTSYYRTAAKNLRAAEASLREGTLFPVDADAGVMA